MCGDPAFGLIEQIDDDIFGDSLMGVLIIVLLGTESRREFVEDCSRLACQVVMLDGLNSGRKDVLRLFTARVPGP